MLYSLQDKYNRSRFAQACHGVLQTAPAQFDGASDVMVFTQLQHKDVLMALLAFKTFASRVAVGHAGILDDGSLTAEDRALLARHLPGVRFFELAQARSAACPTGGCWERLLTIANLSAEHYVIQLDSDTLTVGEIDEVRAHVDQGRSFAIGTWDHQEFETLAERQAVAARVLKDSEGQGNPHIQVVAEAAFSQLASASTLRYVRGCAGFSAFAKGSADRGFIEEISRQMTAAIGDVWHRWGSEQVMSNLVVANTPGAAVLPHPKYCDCTAIQPGTTAFIHFIGSCRFSGSTYRDFARQQIFELNARRS